MNVVSFFILFFFCKLGYSIRGHNGFKHIVFCICSAFNNDTFERDGASYGAEALVVQPDLSNL